MHGLVPWRPRWQRAVRVAAGPPATRWELLAGSVLFADNRAALPLASRRMSPEQLEAVRRRQAAQRLRGETWDVPLLLGQGLAVPAELAGSEQVPAWLLAERRRLAEAQDDGGA